MVSTIPRVGGSPKNLTEFELCGTKIILFLKMVFCLQERQEEMSTQRDEGRGERNRDFAGVRGRREREGRKGRG
jgi:hypothetical protein